MNAVDFFCGGGGMTKGLINAGVNVICGLDYNPACQATYEHNNHIPYLNQDISQVTGAQLQNEYPLLNDTDNLLLVGCAPCQPFSSQRHSDVEHVSVNLLDEFGRLVAEILPAHVLVENVPGIEKRGEAVFTRFLNTLTQNNYAYEYHVLNAKDYGVPQNRHRAIIVAIRQDFRPIEFEFDTLGTLEKVTVEDAIGELYQFESSNPKIKLIGENPASKFRSYLRRDDNLVTDHEVVYPAEKVQERISFVPQGGNWANVPSHLWPSDRKNRHSSAYKRLKEDDQSCTIDTGNAHSNYFHPLYNRIPSIRESARLQSFPDTFEFVGSRGSKYKQVGNAVPPLMAKAIAKQVKKILDENN